MYRKFTFRERIGWWIVDRLSYWLEQESYRQWRKLEEPVEPKLVDPLD